MLWHVRHYWPSGCRYAFNIYRHWKVSVLRGAEEVVYSKEGVTQGDPMAMFLYTLGVLPIILQLKHHQQDVESLTNVIEKLQAWYADDSAKATFFATIREWFQELCQIGPPLCYFPEPDKSILVT
eukprot:4891443-Ditylum_brightwellii.AAC.1